MKRKLLILLAVFSVLLSACGGAQPTQDVDAIVQATFQALTAQAPAATPEAAASTGSISGNLSFPSEGIPPLLVVAYNSTTGQYYWVQTVQNQTTYQIDGLPVGKYTVFAYALPDGKIVGAYDQFYVCGMSQACTDLSLIEVDVQAGGVTSNINPGDWYGDPAQWPPMPNDPSIPNLGVGGESVGTGGIAGQLSFPSSYIPSMMVVAFDVNSQSYQYVITNENSTTYQIDGLAPGVYYVVAYPSTDSSYPGAYSQAVPCGLLATCTDHSLIPVEVKSGEVAQGINPGDFYAPPGTFPPAPAP